MEIDPAIADHSIMGWIAREELKNEKGDPITFERHLFLYDIYLDQSPNLCVMKCAQVGMSTLAVIKNHYDARRYKLDIIYTLPTDGDVGVFVAGKVNRIIANNPSMLADVADKDSIEQKQIGLSFEYFRGTHTKRAMDMVTADRLVHDEIDTSNLVHVRGMQARLQHSRHKQTHVFAHPSTPKNGVHSYWLLSDQKEWFITCKTCGKEQTLSWDTEDPKKMSVDLQKGRYRCKRCDATLDEHERAYGFWRAKKGRKIGTVVTELDGRQWAVRWSGYHINLMMNPDVPATEIAEKYAQVTAGEMSMDWFSSRVLGLPFAGGGNTVPEDAILRCWTSDKNRYKSRLVVGVDTGVALRYVVGNAEGLVAYGQMKAYLPDATLGIPLEDTLEYFLHKFPESVMVIDQGGDITGARQLRKKYPGRVYLCFYQRDRKTMELIRWGAKEEHGKVIVDRNRMIQLLADEVRIGGLQLFNGASAAEWHDYALHWSHIYRVWEKNSLGVDEYVWLRNDRDDWVHATVYWRAGLARFGQTGELVAPEDKPRSNSYMVNPDQTASFDPDEMFRRSGEDAEEEWR